VNLRKGAVVIAISALLRATAAPALADAVANIERDGAQFDSASGTAHAVMAGKGTIYSVNLAGKHLYDTSPPVAHLDLGYAHLSNDGQILAWVLADHFLGGADSLNSPAVAFFRNGKLCKTYTLSELLVRPRFVSYSVSHTQWLPELREANWKFIPNLVFEPDGSKLRFETTSFRKYVFEPASGKMLSGDDTDVWKQADLIVYGEVARIGNGLQMKSVKLLKGTTKNSSKIIFLDPTGTYSDGWHAVALKVRGGESDGWVTSAPEYKLPVIYNAVE
jgi:hypothetical protein